MKKLILCIALVSLTGCQALQTAASKVSSVASSPTTVTTLEALGASVDAAMKVAAGMYHNGQITAAQWNTIASLHDNEFLPAYNAAVATVQNATNQPAAPSLIALGGQIASAVQQMLANPPAATPSTP